MSYETYKLLHLIAIFSLFLSLGALLAYSNGKKRNVMILHGLASFVLLVSGFGLIAKLQLHALPIWVFIKLAVWIVLTIAIPILVAKKVNKKILWQVVWLSGLLAVWMVVAKPLF